MCSRRFNRVQATILIGSIAIVFIFVGRFAFNVVRAFDVRGAHRHLPPHRGCVVMSDRLVHPPRLVGLLRCPAGVQPPAARCGPVLVQPRLELARPGRLARLGGPVHRFRQPARPVRSAHSAILPPGSTCPSRSGWVWPPCSIPPLLWAFPDPRDAFGPDVPRAVPAGPAANTPITSED